MLARFRCALVGLTAATLALIAPAAGGGGRGPLAVAFSSPLAPKATARFVDLATRWTPEPA